MTNEDQRYYETQLDTFISEGWKHFVSQVNEMKQATDRIESIEPDELRYKQGELSMMNWILSWPAQVKTAYEQRLQEDDDDEKEAA